MHLLLNNRGSEPTSDLPDSGKTTSPIVRKGMARVSFIIITLGIVSIFTDISSESEAAVPPLCITRAMGQSTLTCGFIDCPRQGVRVFVCFGGGWAADRAHRPKWIAFAGFSLSTLAKRWLLFASGSASIIAVLADHRIGNLVRKAPRGSRATASSEPAYLYRSFRLHGMLDPICGTVGRLLALLVLFFLLTGYPIIFAISLTFEALGVIVIGLLVTDKRSRRERATALTPPPSRWRDLNDSQLPRLSSMTGLLCPLTISDGFVYLPFKARSEFLAQWFPILHLGTNVAFFHLAISLEGVADRFGHSRVFLVGRVTPVLAFTCFGVLWFAIARGNAVLIVASAFPAVLLGGAIIFAVVAISGYPAQIAASSEVSTTTAALATGSPRIMFRDSAAGKGCGHACHSGIGRAGAR